ncbi:MAG: nitroreductase family protein [Dehalococcoidales bacterium]|nr:nitroreductase family protein [Dehalococcoidales bacterium]
MPLPETLFKEIFRPENVSMGKMKVDTVKCNGCGLCVQNCIFRTWEMGEDKKVHYNKNKACFSCYNCMVACPVDAISIQEPYNVPSGFWKTHPHALPAVKPLEPRNAQNEPDEWTAVEREIFNRRSVRNFSDKPVPEPLIRRVIEAGRFAPTSGNCQPFKFVVVTDKAVIKQLNDISWWVINDMYQSYSSDEKVKNLADAMGPAPATTAGAWDPRIIRGGVGQSVVPRVMPVLLGAPAVILIAADVRSIGGPAIQVGIAGENMVLAANSLGLKATWVGFVAYGAGAPQLRAKLGLEDPFWVSSSIVLGYPKFRQEGIVAREYRPINWVREGGPGLEIEEKPPVPEVKSKRAVKKA